MKKCLTSLDIREKQVKTTLKPSFLVRMAVLINAGENVEKREPLYAAGRNVDLYNHCWNHFRCSRNQEESSLMTNPAYQPWVVSQRTTH